MTQRLILITGGIGSGKSAVGRALGELGFLVIDADRVGHEVLEPGQPANALVAEKWPGVMVGSSVDRRALAVIVFGDRSQLDELETITHPAIRETILERVRAAGDVPVAVELPLLSDLLGDGWIRVVVDAALLVRIDRLRTRGMDQDDIEARLARQPSRDEWIAAAHHVIHNSGSREDLDQEVEALLEALAL
jgi:dephospho-CoA kinase